MASGETSISPWSDPPDFVLYLIVKKLTDAFDYLRFRCVCKSWRSVAKPTDLPPHLPLLMLRYNPFTEYRSILSVSTQQIRTLPIPELVNKEILTASRGWLLLLDVAHPLDGRLFLLNPLTGAEIQLPPTDVFTRRLHHEFSFRKEKFLIGHDYLSAFEYRYTFPWNGFLLSSPNTALTDSMVVIAKCYRFDYVPFWKLGFCKLGDESWTMLETNFAYLPKSMAHHEGRLYMTFENRTASVYDIAFPLNPDRNGLLPDIDFERFSHMFFLTTSSRLLLFGFYRELAHEVNDDGDDEFDYKTRCVIFELMPGNPPRWHVVKSIHDHTVFSSLEQNFIVCTKNFLGCREDSIYFSEPEDLFHEPDDSDVCEMDLFDLKTGDFEHFSGGQMDDYEDMMPSVWIELSLEKVLKQSPVQEPAEA